MIRELVQAGFRLAQTRDTRLVRGLCWAMLEGLLTAAPYLMLYLLLREVFAAAITPARIWAYGLAMAACVLLRILAARIGVPLVFSGAYAMMAQARLRIADHLRRLPMGWFARQRSGDLGARLTSDLELIEHLWSHFLGVFVAGLAMPACVLLFLFWIDWRLALLVLAGVPLAVLALALGQHAVARSGARMIAASAAAQSALLEYVHGIAVIRNFGRFGEVWQRLLTVLNEHQHALLTVETKPAPWLAAYGFLLETGYLSLLLVGAWWLADGTLTPATLLLFLVIALPVYRQLFDVGLSTLMLRFARRALVRIEQILAEPAIPEPAVPKAPHGHDIVFERVHFSYADAAAETPAPALFDLSCRIPAQGLTAVVGPSGAGKSTLVHLIARLWDVDSGSIRLGGVDVRDIGTAALHQHIAMVFQDVLLFSGSVLDNLRIGKPDASREDAIEAARRAQAHDFIEALPQGYDTVLDEGGHSLSGGERQRISMARALLKNAPILLLDEATASIDPSAEAEIQRAIAELARGRTVIVIAHHLNNIRHAEQILVLDKGRLREQGTHAQLVDQNGLYARLWARQQQARQWRLQQTFQTKPDPTMPLRGFATPQS